MTRTPRVAGLVIGLGAGTAGVLGQAVAALVAVAFGEPLVSDPLALPAFATPLEAVASLGVGLAFAAPLLAGPWAFYAVVTDRFPLGAVVAGVLLGGLAYGVGFGLLYWFGFVPGQVRPWPWARGGLLLGVVLAGLGALGALAGDLLAGRVGPVADSNGTLQ